MNTFCWIHGTFTIPAQLTGEVGVNMPHPGIGPTSDPNLIEKLPNGGKQNNTCFSNNYFVKS